MTDQEKCRALAEKLGWKRQCGLYYSRTDTPYLEELVEAVPAPDFAFALLEELARMGFEATIEDAWAVKLSRGPDESSEVIDGDLPSAIINAACAALGVER